MILQHLSLINFRNLTNQNLSFRDKINVIYGDNSQGKTNLLEAIYLISSGKSFRTRIDHELITWGNQECRLQAKAGFFDIEVKVKEQEKEFLINNQKSKVTELIGSFIAVVFTPNDIEIINGSPDKRRKFLDQLGSLLDRKYLFTLLQFAKVLRNRNQTLWQMKNGKKTDLSIWNRHLISNAVKIWSYRNFLVEKLNTELKTVGKKLTGSSLEIAYKPQIKTSGKKTLKDIYEEKLKEMEEEEVKKGVTLLGPQRDDFSLIADEVRGDKITSKDLGIYGSRGEQRAAILALKLVEVALLTAEKNDPPVLLLDEVLSELDFKHREYLLKEVRSLQTFITTTSLESLNAGKFSDYAKYEVDSGKIIVH